MAQQTSGMPELKYSEETFREMYEVLKYCHANLINLRDNPKGFTNDILESLINDSIKVLAQAEGK